jgi:trypsin
MSRRTALGVAVALVLGACTQTPTSTNETGGPDFITYGVTDDGEHPYVGFMLFFDPNEPDWFSCTGTLLDAQTLLSAGHCTFGVGKNGSATPTGSGGNDVWVSFNEKIDLTGFPKRADFPNDEAGLYAARSAWLNANRNFIRGTSYPHPKFDNFREFPANHDVGVVELNKSTRLRQYGVLAPLGTLDKLAANSGDKVIVETAGYGIQEIKPDFISLDERWKSTSMVVNLKSALTDGWNVHTSNNPSAANGQGGTCFGDSGGGVFLDNTNVIVAVVSFGINNNCKGADYQARTDITDSRDFILPFLR